MSEYSELLESIKGLAQGLGAINQQAVREYAPIVDHIVRTRSQDVRHIEHTLDGLLDFCGHEPALRHFRKLCRYYWELNPVSTAGYINAYRDLFDSDNEAAFDPDKEARS